MITDKINKLTLPATILIASLILGGFYYATQVNKQQSIERQQQIKLQEDRRAEEAKAEQEQQWRLTKELKEQQSKEEAEQALSVCIDNAEKEAQRVNQGLLDYAKTAESKQYDLSGAFDDVERQLEKDKAECFKRYPQN